MVFTANRASNPSGVLGSESMKAPALLIGASRFLCRCATASAVFLPVKPEGSLGMRAARVAIKNYSEPESVPLCA